MIYFTEDELKQFIKKAYKENKEIIYYNLEKFLEDSNEKINIDIHLENLFEYTKNKDFK